MNRGIFTKRIQAIIGLLCLFTLSVKGLYAQSLEQAVALALDTHPDIRQAFARFKSKEEDVNRATAGYLPTVDITAGYGYEYTDTPSNRRSGLGIDDGETELGRGEFGVSLRQMLFDGMFTSSEVKRTKFEASAEQWALISTAEDLALSVSQAYLNYLKNQQLVTLSEKNVESHQKIYGQIKERTDSGIGSIADLSQVTGRLARAQSNLIAARNNYQDARAQFISLTNITPDDLVMPVPDADLLPKDNTSGLLLAIERHPIIKSARQDIHAARAFGSSVKANYYPKFSLELAANSDNDLAGENGLNRFDDNVGGHRNDLSVMLRMRYNLYSGGKDVALERSAAYKTIEAQEINYRAHRQVTESFGLAWNAYSMLGLQKQYIQEHVVTSKDTQEAYQQQFSLGQRNLLDLLDTENELFQARKDYLDANFDELSARYRLLNVTGQLLDSLRVTRSAEWQGEHEYDQGANHE
nr:TolC family outer membrane protein [uncultured Glaciecola sp.]